MPKSGRGERASPRQSARRNQQEGIEQPEREAAEARRKAEKSAIARRGSQAQGRTRSQEAFRRGRGQGSQSGNRRGTARCRHRRSGGAGTRALPPTAPTRMKSAPDSPRPRRRRPPGHATEDNRETGAAEAARALTLGPP